LLVVVLGDIHPPGRQRLVPLGLEAIHQIGQIRVQSLTILMPASSVDATSFLLAERLIASPQELDVQQMS
jgi:hypothetical protein